MKSPSLPLSIYSMHSKVDICLPSLSEQSTFDAAINFLKLFGETDEQTYSISLVDKHVLTLQKRAEIGRYIARHVKDIHAISELGEWLKRMANDEIFYVLPKCTPQVEEQVKFNLLKANTPDFDQGTHEVVQETLVEIQKNYRINIFNEKTASIGEPDKQKRVCLFCGEANPKNYQRKAHAISESLGNKLLVQYEECDTCNEKFGKTFEKDFANFMLIFRSQFGVSGKKGIPKQEGKHSVEFSNIDNVFCVRINVDSDDVPEEYLPHQIHIPITEKVSLQGVYKTLVKYCISLIGNEHREAISTTAKWLNGDFIWNKQLPNVAKLLDYYFFTDKPWAICYTRTSDDVRLPKFTIEFHFLMFVFVAIVPFVEESESKFIDETSYTYFWNTMTHLKRSDRWMFLDYSAYEPRTINFTFNMTQKVSEEFLTLANTSSACSDPYPPESQTPPP